MKKVKIHCIRAKVKRLNRPDMIKAYKEMAITWTGDICELDEEDHRDLQAMWDEKYKPAVKKPCHNCRGIG